VHYAIAAHFFFGDGLVTIVRMITGFFAAGKYAIYNTPGALLYGDAEAAGKGCEFESKLRVGHLDTLSLRLHGLYSDLDFTPIESRDRLGAQTFHFACKKQQC
jgi:hypothetical protein